MQLVAKAASVSKETALKYVKAAGIWERNLQRRRLAAEVVWCQTCSTEHVGLGTAHGLCLPCQRAKEARDRDGNRKAIRLRQQEKRRVGMLRVAVIKEASPCTDCGKNFRHYQMDFDHRPGEAKRINVSNMGNYAWEVVEAEITKCDLVCANCHRERTWQRGWPGGRPPQS